MGPLYCIQELTRVTISFPRSLTFTTLWDLMLPEQKEDCGVSRGPLFVDRWVVLCRSSICCPFALCKARRNVSRLLRTDGLWFESSSFKKSNRFCKKRKDGESVMLSPSFSCSNLWGRDPVIRPSVRQHRWYGCRQRRERDRNLCP